MATPRRIQKSGPPGLAEAGADTYIIATKDGPFAVRTDLPPDKTTTRSPVRDCAARFSGLIAEIAGLSGRFPWGVVASGTDL
jgi:hypothetical protein